MKTKGNFQLFSRLAFFKCFFVGHKWVARTPTRRACKCCLRREVLFSSGYFLGKWHEEWIEHTYPLNEDPAKDPTVVRRDGFVYTLGELHEFQKLLTNITNNVQ